jgi:glycolate oxidase
VGAVQRKQIAELRRILDPDRVLDQSADRATYAYDATAGLSCEPDAIVFPQSTDEVSALLRFAAAHAIPVVPRGSGTGLSGGAVPVPGALVICTARFDRIVEVDPVNRTILVEPGVLTQAVADAAAEHGLFYPPDPGSIRVCTIGGNVAENAGGLRGLKYGVTRDYVMALEVVLPDGEAIRVGSNCVKDVAGYSLKDVFLGSEGTLGIVTKILLKLVCKPEAKQTRVAMFDSFEAAANAGTELLRVRVTPCTLEFLDRITMQCVEEFAKLGLPDADAMLLIECDGHPAAVADEMKIVEEVCPSAEAADGERFAEARRAAFAALARRKPVTLLEDATVPRTRLAEMVRFIQAVAEKHELWIGTFGHLGDGNLHPTCLCEKDELPRAHEAFAEIFRRAIELGGTITGEHGVGLAKKPYLEATVGSRPLAIMKELKHALDPDGLLNPGKVL